ncbi:uncharacterized protein [Epargyreus clarus]|uniref:uncharacterized protein n=1 Tax=Epargyreus clarus TaxID=520877 RepID=UPI003C2CD139
MYCFLAALKSLEREAKENVYAVLDPHVQYELTINKHGEPPKYLSLSKPLTHQRTHAFDPQNISAYEINNNNNFNDNRFSTFKSGPPKIRRSDRSSYRRNNKNQQNYVCKSNYDIEYSRDPFFGMARDNRNTANNYAQRDVKNNTSRGKANYRMYERNGSGKRNNNSKKNEERDNYVRNDPNRSSNNRKVEDKIVNRVVRDKEKERSFEEYKVQYRNDDGVEELPRPGKVREIASRFNRNSVDNGQPVSFKTDRPKPLQSCDQAYLDHIFPDAVEI